jgi:integrase
MKTKISDLTEKTFVKWAESRIEGGTKAVTVSKNIVALRSCFDFGVERELIKENPLTNFKLFKKLGIRKDGKEIVSYLSEDEDKRLFAALEAREKEIREGRERHINLHVKYGSLPHVPQITGAYADYLKPLVIVALFTGLRRGSLFSMQWSDIDFSSSVITLPPEKHKTGDKTRKALRLKLNDTARETLLAWRDCCPDSSPSAYVFASPQTGGRLDNIQTSWENLLAAANIKNFRFNDLRHTFASRLAMNGVPLAAIKTAMGHTKIEMTLRYAHLSEDSIEDAVKSLDSPKC